MNLPSIPTTSEIIFSKFSTALSSDPSYHACRSKMSYMSCFSQTMQTCLCLFRKYEESIIQYDLHKCGLIDKIIDNRFKEIGVSENRNIFYIGPPEIKLDDFIVISYVKIYQRQRMNNRNKDGDERKLNV